MKSGERFRSPAPRSGSVLILVVWVLFLLGLLAIAAGSQAARRLAAAERLRGRLQSYAAARAGIAHAVAVLVRDTNAWDALHEPWADSEADFRAVRCGECIYSVLRLSAGSEGEGVGTNFGASDEEGRIDLNLSPQAVLQGLFVTVGGLDSTAAFRLATNVLAARSMPEQSRASGASVAFACLPDLLALEGVTEPLLRRIEPYVTVHGGRRVNLNTADMQVIAALMAASGTIGEPAPAATSLARKILQFREQGGMFTTYMGPGLVAALEGTVALEGDERAALSGLSPFVTMVSDRFRIVSVGEAHAGRRFSRRIECVWNRATRKFESWNED